MFNKIFATKKDLHYSQNTINALRLIRSENVGNKTFFDLIRLFGKPCQAITHVEEMSLKGGRKKPIKLFPLDAAMAELEKASKLGVSIIAYNDEYYPKLLSHIHDAPPIISAIGRLSLLQSQSVAIVGARNCSIAGIQFTNQLAKEISEAGLTIVSGFARGIDTAAHKASLDKATVAVLAGGIDHIYPQENKDLYYQIAEKGCIIAELPIGSSPSSQHFPQRNRIIAGLCLATLVIEASLGSGSLITANLALEQGREVFAVPGFPADPRYKGNNKLLKQGATMLESSADVLSQLPNFKIPISDNNLQDNAESPFIGKRNISSISDTHRTEVLSLLSNTPVNIELISSHLQIPINVVLCIIIELELASKILRHPGNKISINPTDF